jgi:hypothetical protein
LLRDGSFETINGGAMRQTDPRSGRRRMFKAIDGRDYGHR